MRILKVIHQFPPDAIGGSELYAFRLSRTFSTMGHEVTVVHTVNRPEEPEYALKETAVEGLRVFTVNRRRRTTRNKWARALLFWLHTCRTYENDRVDAIIERIVTQIQPDVVHVHHVHLLSSSLLARVRAHGIPVVVTLHDYWFMCWSGGQKMRNDATLCSELPDCGAACVSQLVERALGLTPSFYDPRRYSWRRRAFRLGMRTVLRVMRPYLRRAVRMRRDTMRQVLNGADCLIAPSEFLRQAYIAFGVDANRIRYSDYGTEAPGGAPSVRNGGGVIRFAFVGRLVPEKGLHVLIQAFNGLGKRATLDIHGAPQRYAQDYERYLHRLARDPGIQFHGACPPERIYDALRESDMVVVPSLWWENSPLVIHEAFAMGIPVIAAEAGGMQELVQHRRNGLLFPLGDVEGLRWQLQTVLTEPALIGELRRGIPRVKSMTEDAHAFLVLYAECQQRRKGTAGSMGRGP